MDGPQQTLSQNLELRFQYCEDSHWRWFVIYTKQVSSHGRAGRPSVLNALLHAGVDRAPCPNPSGAE